MSPDGIHYYIVKAISASVTTPCGNSMTFPSGSGYYVMATDWQNTCLWTEVVPTSLGELYIGPSMELRFRRWITAPLQFADTLIDPGNDELYIDGAFQQSVGLIDPVVIARARYDLFGLPTYPSRFVRTLSKAGAPLLAVNFSDSVRLGDSVLVSTEPRTIAAELNSTGGLSRTWEVGEGEMLLGSLDSDSNGNVYVGAFCWTCTVIEETVGAEFPYGKAFMVRASQGPAPDWVWLSENYSYDPAHVRVASSNRIVAAYAANFPGSGATTFGAGLVQVDSTGSALHSELSLAGSWSAVGVPEPKIDAESNVVTSTYYVGGNPDQIIHCIDSVGNFKWLHNLNQGGNLFGLGVYPVDTNTYLVLGTSELSQTLGSFTVSPPPNNNQYVRFSAKLADFNVSAPERTRSSKGAAVWPNPTSDQLILQLRAATPIRILDAQGRVVQQAQGVAGMNTIDVRALRAGPYAIAAGQSVTRFVKE